MNGLGPIERVPNELWTEFIDMNRRRGQDHPYGKEMQKSKMAVWGGLTNSCEKTGSKKQRRKERCTHLNAEFQRIARRDKKACLSDQ